MHRLPDQLVSMCRDGFVLVLELELDGVKIFCTVDKEISQTALWNVICGAAASFASNPHEVCTINCNASSYEC